MLKLTTLVLLFCSFQLHAYSSANPTCDISVGMADSYVLALSSHPGFCKTYGYEAGKPECVNISDHSYEANHLTLHGLWPSQNACGIHYDFCSSKQLTNHCDYSPINFSPNVSADLKVIMPSYRYGSCLERHEWNKHGSCQVLSSDDYFSLAMRLAKEMDKTVFAQFIAKEKGHWVKLDTLLEQLAHTFGPENVRKIYLGCNKNTLVDVYISLPALIPYEESLHSLVGKASNYPVRNSCSASVFISDFNGKNQETWF